VILGPPPTTQGQAAYAWGMFCIGCGYDLKGLTRTTCPECGRRFSPGDPETYACGPPSPVKRSIIVQALAAGLAWFSVAPMYIAWMQAWFILGRRPQAHIDDPKLIAGLTLYPEPVYCCTLAPVALLIHLVLLSWLALRAEWMLAAVHFWIALVSWVLIVLLVVFDPLRVCAWYFD
jgi:hypothetical protein